MSDDTLAPPGAPDEPLHDESLRKALAQAPDRAVLPDWRIRQAILDHAHDAVSAAEELREASRAPAAWWSPSWWRDKVGVSRSMPWSAAFATVLVGVLITLVWRREPVPGPQLDDRTVASAPTPAPAPAPAPAPLAREEESRKAQAPAKQQEQQPAPAQDSMRASAAPPAPVPAAPPAVAPEPPPPPAPMPAPVPAPVEPAPKLAASPPPAPEPPARQRAAPAAPAAAAGAPPAAAGGVRSDATPPPDFASLGRWSELRIANVNGDVRIVARADAGELSLLLSSAAIMAVGAQPLRAVPEWRVALERRGAVLAVLEVGRNQVRWTEGGAPPATGTPPIESVEALRSALRQAAQAKAPGRAVAPVEPVRPPPPEPAPASEDAQRVPLVAPPPPTPPAAAQPLPEAPEPPPAATGS